MTLSLGEYLVVTPWTLLYNRNHLFFLTVFLNTQYQIKQWEVNSFLLLFSTLFPLPSRERVRERGQFSS
jgi:hypothetical protein